MEGISFPQRVCGKGLLNRVGILIILDSHFLIIITDQTEGSHITYLFTVVLDQDL